MKPKILLKRATAVSFASLLLATSSISYVSAEPTDSDIMPLDEIQQEVVTPDTSKYTDAAVPSAFQKGADAYSDTDMNSMARIAPMPSEYYLLDQGLSTTVKDQDPWGTCWAFANVSALESNILVNQQTYSGSLESAQKEQSLPDYSERHLAWLTYQPQSEISLAGTPTGTSQAGEGLFTEGNPRLDMGGNSQFASTLLTAWNGPVSESVVPYQNVNGGMETSISWEVSDELRTLSEAQVQNVDFLPSPADYDENSAYIGYNAAATDAIKQSMLEHGAISILYAADQSRPNAQGNSTYFNYRNWCQYVYDDNYSVNHSVSLVGWDDNYSKDNFNPDHQPENDGAWLVKNSWGNTGWGTSVNGSTGGYFWLSYYDRSITNVTSYNSVTSDTGTVYDHNYQYDYLGWMGDALPYTEQEPIASANVFTAQGPQLLEAVSAATFTPGCSVEAYVYLLSDEDTDTPVPIPAEGSTATPVATASDSFAQAGFHTLTLDTPVRLKEGQRFSVVEVVTQENGLYIALMEYAGTHGVQTAVCNPGESYALMWNGSTIDSSFTTDSYIDIATRHEQNNNIGNVMIKAFTTNADTTAEESPTVSSITCQAFDVNHNAIGDALAFPLTEGANSGLTLPAGTAYLKINSIDRADRAVEDYNPFSITVNGSNYNLGDDISLANFVKAEGSDSPIVIHSTNFWGANERLYSIDFTSPILELTGDNNNVVVKDTQHVLPVATRLNAEKITSGDLYKQLSVTLSELGTVSQFYAYNITLDPALGDGQTVSLSITPDSGYQTDTAKLYYIDVGSNKMTAVKVADYANSLFSVENGKTGFYAVAVIKEKTTPTPGTSDSTKQVSSSQPTKTVKTGDTTSAIPFLAMLLIAGILILILATRLYKINHKNRGGN